MKGKNIYSDSNQKDVNNAIVFVTIILAICMCVALLKDDAKLGYTFVGIDVVLIYLFKRSQYVFEICENEIEKRWVYRVKTRVYNLNSLLVINYEIRTGFNSYCMMSFSLAQGDRLKNVVFTLSKDVQAHRVFISFLINHPHINLKTHKWVKEGREEVSCEEALEILGERV